MTSPMIRTSGLVKEFPGFRAVGGADGADLVWTAVTRTPWPCETTT